jgi:4-aminobutyrate aminotransferase / (S)-3-amino-2-methylpropionate transaminase / 5-aminovalerate transaminase
VTGSELPHVVTSLPGPRSREAMARLGERECPAFAERRQSRSSGTSDPSGIVLARGEGANLYDVDGNRYVDLAAGFGAVLLGHGPSAAHAAAHTQIDRLVQGLGDLYASDVKVELVEQLARLHPDPGARVLLCQSGADAVTAALKTAALRTERPGVVAFEGAYHGLGYAPLAACGFKASFREPFEAQLNPHVHFAPFPSTSEAAAECLASVERSLATGEIGAVLFEPLLGRGGVVVPPPGFLRELVALARAHGALSIADEIWTGLGRAGGMLRSFDEGASTDLVVLGKGLGASFPISACIGSADAMSGWSRGGSVIHTSTHAGAPLGCAAALATLSELEQRALPARARIVGERVRRLAHERLASSRGFVQVRGAGLVIGVELASGALGLAAHGALLARGYLLTLGGRSTEVLVATPPLDIAEPLLDAWIEALAEVLGELAASRSPA